MNVPERIPIKRDDYHAKYVGLTPDGRQFFFTTPYVLASREPGCEFLARFLFDSQGNLCEDTIDNLGPRNEMDGDSYLKLSRQRIEELGDVTYGDILVKPFSIERFGVTFGLIPFPPQQENGNWWVEFHPGNYMAFTDPWDGHYDT